jgi:hypothetical protein
MVLLLPHLAFRAFHNESDSTATLGYDLKWHQET